MQIQPEVYYFKDDGRIPNSQYPLLIYRDAFTTSGNEGAAALEQKFASNGWTNSWRDGIYPFLHYHSTAHEVLGIYKGAAQIRLGGEKGKNIEVHAGDIIVIPAGVGHKRLSADDGLGVVGAYANGRDYDILKGAENERPKADQNIAAVPFPEKDPLLGKEEGLEKLWKQENQ